MGKDDSFLNGLEESDYDEPPERESYLERRKKIQHIRAQRKKDGGRGRSKIFGSFMDLSSSDSDEPDSENKPTFMELIRKMRDKGSDDEYTDEEESESEDTTLTDVSMVLSPISPIIQQSWTQSPPPPTALRKSGNDSFSEEEDSEREQTITESPTSDHSSKPSRAYSERLNLSSVSPTLRRGPADNRVVPFKRRIFESPKAVRGSTSDEVHEDDLVLSNVNKPKESLEVSPRSSSTELDTSKSSKSTLEEEEELTQPDTVDVPESENSGSMDVSDPAESGDDVPESVNSGKVAAMLKSPVGKKQSEDLGSSKKEPTATPSKPAASPSNPATTPSKPAATPCKPAATPSKPATTPSNPAVASSKPSASPSKPAEIPSKPAAASSKPAATPSKPSASLRRSSRIRKPSGISNTPGKSRSISSNLIQTPQQPIRCHGVRSLSAPHVRRAPLVQIEANVMPPISEEQPAAAAAGSSRCEKAAVVGTPVASSEKRSGSVRSGVLSSRKKQAAVRKSRRLEESNLAAEEAVLQSLRHGEAAAKRRSSRLSKEDVSEEKKSDSAVPGGGEDVHVDAGMLSQGVKESGSENLMESEKSSVEKAAAEKERIEKEAADRASADKEAADKATAKQKAAEKAASDKAVADKAVADKVTADKAVAKKKAAEKAAADKAAVDKKMAAKAAAKKKAVDKAAKEKFAPKKTTDTEKELSAKSKNRSLKNRSKNTVTSPITPRRSSRRKSGPVKQPSGSEADTEQLDMSFEIDSGSPIHCANYPGSPIPVPSLCISRDAKSITPRAPTPATKRKRPVSPSESPQLQPRKRHIGSEKQSVSESGAVAANVSQEPMFPDVMDPDDFSGSELKEPESEPGQSESESGVKVPQSELSGKSVKKAKKKKIKQKRGRGRPSGKGPSAKAPTAAKKKRKTNKRVFTPKADRVRYNARPKRNRGPPLRAWMNERNHYVTDENGDLEMVNIEKPTNEKDWETCFKPKTPKRKRKRPAANKPERSKRHKRHKRPRKNPKNRDASQSHDSNDQVDLLPHEDQDESGADIQGTVFDLEGVEHNTVFGKRFQGIELFRLLNDEPGEDNEVARAGKALDTDDGSSGYIFLPPGKGKTTERPKKPETFSVHACEKNQLEVVLNNQSNFVSKGDVFHVASDNPYTLHNRSKTHTARIFFFINRAWEQMSDESVKE
eukprot:442297_1